MSEQASTKTGLKPDLKNDFKSGLKDRPTYELVLRPERGVDGVSALKAGLKRLLRNHGLRCVHAREIKRGTHAAQQNRIQSGFEVTTQRDRP